MLIWEGEFKQGEADARIDNPGPSESRENVPLPVFLRLICVLVFFAAMGEAVARAMVEAVSR